MKYEVALVPKVIALYRTSPNAMTTDPERMLKAQRQFIEKHYGEPGSERGSGGWRWVKSIGSARRLLRCERSWGRRCGVRCERWR